jgi:hypothetical protein
MPEQPTRAVQDYLKAIHQLGGAEGVASPVEIADRLEVRAPSVTGMLKRLVGSATSPATGPALPKRGSPKLAV